MRQVEWCQVDPRGPTSIPLDPRARCRERGSNRGRARRGHDQQPMPIRGCAPSEVVDESEGQLARPSQVVDGDDRMVDALERSMCRFEDADRFEGRAADSRGCGQMARSWVPPAVSARAASARRGGQRDGAFRFVAGHFERVGGGDTDAHFVDLAGLPRPCTPR